CALLVACGGGGGGGGGTPPTAAPTSTPTQGPTAPAPQSTAVSLDTQTMTHVSFGSVTSGGATGITRASATLPLASSSVSGTFSVSATAPGSVPVPSSRTVHLKKAQTLGVPTTPVVYFALTLNSAATVYTAPGLTLNGVTVTQPCYLVMYDPGNPG